MKMSLISGAIVNWAQDIGVKSVKLCKNLAWIYLSNNKKTYSNQHISKLIV